MSLKFWLLVAGTGVGEAGDLGALKGGNLLALRGFMIDVFPDGPAVGVENLKAETIEAGLQLSVCPVPDDDAGEVMLGAEVDFPERSRVAVAVVGDTFGFVEITIRVGYFLLFRKSPRRRWTRNSSLTTATSWVFGP